MKNSKKSYVMRLFKMDGEIYRSSADLARVLGVSRNALLQYIKYHDLDGTEFGYRGKHIKIYSSKIARN